MLLAVQYGRGFRQPAQRVVFAGYRLAARIRDAGHDATVRIRHSRNHLAAGIRLRRDISARGCIGCLVLDIFRQRPRGILCFRLFRIAVGIIQVAGNQSHLMI